MMGLIDSKKHRGAVITSPDLVSILEKRMNAQILDDATLREIFEMRLALEIGMADLIIERVKPEDIAELKRIVVDQPNDSSHELFLIDQEIRFHSKLYDITGNEPRRSFRRCSFPFLITYITVGG